ncbi:MAG: DNA internalization-related competence protein ComEC/Rec2 [bacterium]|nr:DNA internalization-related competence protein ComEC/Rec2 [bacterium]
MKQSPILYLFLSSVIGAYFGLLNQINPIISLSFAFAAAVAALVVQNKYIRALLVLVFCFLFTAALANKQISHYKYSTTQIPTNELILEGIISDLTQSLENGSRATFHVTGSINNNIRSKLNLNLTLFLKESAAALPLSEGDRIRIFGKIKTLKRALSPGAFDPFWYGLSRKIDGSIAIHKSFNIGVLSKQSNVNFFSNIRQKLRHQLLKLSTPRETGVILALVVGDTYLFEKDQRQIYQNLGAGHLLAVSGLQVSLLALIFFYIFKLIFNLIPYTGRRSYGNKLAVIFSLFAIWSFTLLCGAPPSAVRAAAMSSVLLASIIIIRQSSIFDAFGISGLVIVLLWPASVVDPSFLLSYAAVLGLLIAGNTHGNNELEDTTNESIFSDAKFYLLVKVSLGAGLLTLPITAHLFGQVSPWGIIVNIILVPIAVLLQTPAIFLGVFGALLSSVTLVKLAANFAGMLEALCDFFNSLVGNLIFLPSPSKLATVFLILFSLGLLKIFNSNRKIYYGLLSLILITSAILIDLEWQKGIRITVLPVGQGDATVFEFPSGETILVDGGGNFNSDYDPGKEIIIPFLKRRRINQLEAIVLSHPDSDHLLGLFSVINAISIKELWYQPLPNEHVLLSKLLELAESKKINSIPAHKLVNNKLFGAAKIQIFPSKPKSTKISKKIEINNFSLALKVSFGLDSALWPGDLEVDGENYLVNNYKNLSTTVVKAAHHGSKSSSTLAFVKQTHPKHVIFCTKEDNMWHFPHSQIVKRWHDVGAQTWNTGTQGEITIWLTGNGTLVKAFREE